MPSLASSLSLLGAALGALVLALPAAADKPAGVIGKEYDTRPDTDATGAADPEQGLLWDGLGAVADGFDYSGSRVAAGDEVDREVDALANQNDALFVQLVSNTASLLFGVEGDGNIYFENNDGSSGIWATPAEINAANPPQHVDGLEVWGPEGASDSDRYSLEGDPAIGILGRISVWSYDGTTNTSTALISTAQIAALIGIPVDGRLFPLLDLDGLMVNPAPPSTHPIAQLVFSIRPIVDPTDGSLVFDGGEIWTWDGMAAAASFLVHGGHTWDTAFDVAGTFGLGSENVSAIEAVGFVPEPGTAALLAFGLSGLALRSRNRRPRG